MKVKELRKYRDRLINEGAVCEYCGAPMQCFDHMEPTSRGGSQEVENLARCCISCNAEKGNKTTNEYIRYLKMKANIADSLLRDRGKIIEEAVKYAVWNMSVAMATTAADFVSKGFVKDWMENSISVYEEQSVGVKIGDDK